MLDTLTVGEKDMIMVMTINTNMKTATNMIMALKTVNTVNEGTPML